MRPNQNNDGIARRRDIVLAENEMRPNQNPRYAGMV